MWYHNEDDMMLAGVGFPGEKMKRRLSPRSRFPFPWKKDLKLRTAGYVGKEEGGRASRNVASLDQRDAIPVKRSGDAQIHLPLSSSPSPIFPPISRKRR